MNRFLCFKHVQRSRDLCIVVRSAPSSASMQLCTCKGESLRIQTRECMLALVLKDLQHSLEDVSHMDAVGEIELFHINL